MTVTVALCPQPIQQYLNNQGELNVGGYIQTTVGGLNAVTYQDAAGSVPLPNPIPLNSRGETSDVSGHTQQVFLPINTVYVFTVFDRANNQLDQFSYVNATQISPAQIGAIIYPILGYEGSSVVDIIYPYGDPRRYGATGGPAGTIPSTDDSAGWAAAVSTGYVNLPGAWAFKVVTGAAFTGQIVIVGQGQTSQMYCDSPLVTVTNGTGSIVDNIWAGNITAPWIVSRNPANMLAIIPTSSLVQSNTQLGYQPTVNDREYSTWVSAIPAVGTQNIGPYILFKGAATGVTVSRIYGRFVNVVIQDAIQSTIRDCDYRGGKAQWGGLYFDNWTNFVQRGSGNRSINNRVQYASNSGVTFLANDDFENAGSISEYNGESGTKTGQAVGITFTASVGGGVSGTLSAAITNGAYTCIFSDGEQRVITVTGGTAVTWTTNLASGSITTATIWQTTAQGGVSDFNPQCFRGKIGPVHANFNYYDGCDCISTVSTSNDSAITNHKIFDVYAVGNGGDGLNTDGQGNSVADIHADANYAYGILNFSSNSDFFGLHLTGNSVANGATYDLLGGAQGNTFTGVTIRYGGTGSGPLFGQQASGQAPHTFSNITTFNGTNFYGNPGQIIPVVNNNQDATTGHRTRQSGLFFLRNNAGTLQHAFQNDIVGAASPILSRILGNSAAFTNTPTGTDASTNFAAGAKVSTTDTNGVVFNTAAQWAQDVDFEARLVTNSTTTNLTISVSFESFSVNGTTLTRPLFRFWNATTGAAFVINTTNVGTSTNLQVEFTGYLS